MIPENLKSRQPLLPSAPVAWRNGIPYFWLGGQHYALQGQDASTALTCVISHIDGLATHDEIVERIVQAEGVSKDWAQNLLGMLKEMGVCVTDIEHPEDRALRQHYLSQIQYFAQHTSFPTDLQKRLQASRVVVIGLDYIGNRLVEELARAGIGHVRGVGNPTIELAEAALTKHESTLDGIQARHPYLAHLVENHSFAGQYEGLSISPGRRIDWDSALIDGDLAILILDRPDPPLLQAFNHACLTRRVPFLPLWLEETEAHIGPLVQPYETACLVCFERRCGDRLTREMLHSLLQPVEAIMPAWEDHAFSRAWIATVASNIADDVVTTLSGYRRPALLGQALRIDRRNRTQHSSPVLKLPRCPSCSRLRHIPSSQPFTLSNEESEVNDS